MKNLLLFLPLLAVVGCTSTAGPYITNISSDGRGNLVIEKNTVLWNRFSGTVMTGDTPTSYTVKVCPDK